jgi:hypothetical protein
VGLRQSISPPSAMILKFSILCCVVTVISLFHKCLVYYARDIAYAFYLTRNIVVPVSKQDLDFKSSCRGLYFIVLSEG